MGSGVDVGGLLRWVCSKPVLGAGFSAIGKPESTAPLPAKEDLREARKTRPYSTRRTVGWLLAALILGAFLLSLPYQTMPARRVEVGAEAAAGALTGFSFPEIAADGQTFRWSETGASARNLAEGTVIFPDVANRPLAIRLRLAAPRPAGEPVVTLTVNGREIGSFPAGGVFAEYAFSADREAVGWDGDVIVGLRVPPFTVPPDTRELGAAVAWVEIAPTGGPAIPPSARPGVSVLLPVLLGAAGSFWLARRFRWSAPAAAGLAVGLAALGALWVRVDEGGALRWAWLIPAGGLADRGGICLGAGGVARRCDEAA